MHGDRQSVLSPAPPGTMKAAAFSEFERKLPGRTDDRFLGRHTPGETCVGLLEGLDPDYYQLRFESPADHRLFVVFSSVGTKVGAFSLFNIFRRMRVNVLQLSPPDPVGWYSSGLSGLGSDCDMSFAALADRLGKWCREQGIQQIIVVGHSMGGYGALRFVARTNPGIPMRAVITSAEVRPMLRGSKSLHFNPGGNFQTLEFDEFAPNEVDLFFGELDLADSYCALLLKNKKNVTLRSISNSDHSVSAFLHKTRGLGTFLEEYLSGKVYFAGRGFLADALDAEDLEPLLIHEPFSPTYMAALESCLDKYPGYGLGWHRMGVHFNNQKRYAEAIVALKHSLLSVPDYSNSHEHLALARSRMAKAMSTPDPDAH